MTSNSVAIIDSGGANIASLLYAFERLSAAAILTTDATTIQAAQRVILPGVGAAKDAMERLRDNQLVDVIRRLTQPVLGICLGMQLLAEGSDEEDVECLGILPGTATKFNAQPGFPVPNMGWCSISNKADHAIFSGMGNVSWFYFVHSYALPVSKYTIAEANHFEPFSAMACKENFIAAQFHPERSSATGSRLLRNFLEMPA